MRWGRRDRDFITRYWPIAFWAGNVRTQLWRKPCGVDIAHAG
jgi:hypothetical protein